MDDDSRYQLVSNVPEHLAAHVSRGTRVMVHLDSLHRTLPATIVEYRAERRPGQPNTHRESQSAPCNGVQSGLFARMNVPSGSESTLSIPAGAVVERNGLTGVYVLDEADTAQLHAGDARRYAAMIACRC